MVDILQMSCYIRLNKREYKSDNGDEKAVKWNLRKRGTVQQKLKIGKKQH